MSTAIAALLVLSLDRGRGKATRLRVSNVEEERRIGQSMIWVSCYTDEVITGHGVLEWFIGRRWILGWNLSTGR